MGLCKADKDLSNGGKKSKLSLTCFNLNLREQYDEKKYNEAHKHFCEHGGVSKKNRTYMLDNDVLAVDMQYPCIHESGQSGDHFSQGHGKFLEEIFEIGRAHV